MIEGFGHWKMQMEARRRREELDETSLGRLVYHHDAAKLAIRDDKDARKLGYDDPEMVKKRKRGKELAAKQFKRKTGNNVSDIPQRELDDLHAKGAASRDAAWERAHKK